MVVERGGKQLLPWHVPHWRKLQATQLGGKLPHALLLAGPEGVGKKHFASHLAKALVCEHADVTSRPCGQCRSCGLVGSATHPDVYSLEPEEEGKNIRIDAVRELIARSTLTTQANGLRVFVISPAQAMNRAASNALLKTLEEPSAANVFILVSSQPHLLPATIRSRCQQLLFKPVGLSEAEDWLLEKVDPAQRSALLAYTGGAPLLASKAAEEGWISQTQAVIDQLLALKLRKINPMTVVAQWLEKPLEQLLTQFSRICSDLVQLRAAGQARRLFMPGSEAQLQSLARDINLQALYHFNDELNLLRRQMTHNLNPQMVLEKIVNEWLALTRPASRAGVR